MLPIALIEDMPAIREALAEYLDLQPEFRCVLAADSVESFLAGLADAPAAPQLILSDIGLPGRSGIEGLPLIRARLPQAQVVMLSVFADAERVFQALCAGAVGYLLKNTPPATIKESLLQVAQGGSAMSPGIARLVIGHFRPRQASEESLSPREQQIVQGIEEGLSYKLIAARLGISPDTVRNHIQQVYRKLRVNSKGEIMARAYQRNQRGE